MKEVQVITSGHKNRCGVAIRIDGQSAEEVKAS